MGLFDTREELNEIRNYIAKTLDIRINIIIEQKLNEWFETNLQNRFDKVIREELDKIIIVKLNR